MFGHQNGLLQLLGESDPLFRRLVPLAHQVEILERCQKVVRLLIQWDPIRREIPHRWWRKQISVNVISQIYRTSRFDAGPFRVRWTHNATGRDHETAGIDQEVDKREAEEDVGERLLSILPQRGG